MSDDSRSTSPPEIGDASMPWSSWLHWVLANTLAGIVMGLLLFADFGESAFAAIILNFSGVPIGIAQWSVLKQRLPRAGWWIPASIFGWAMGWILGNVVSLLAGIVFVYGAGMSPFQNGAILGSLGLAQTGMLLGVTQFLVLKRTVSRPRLWILANTGSWGIGWLLGWTIGWQVREILASLLTKIVGVTVTAAISGAITGSVLIWLLQADGGSNYTEKIA